MPSDDEPTLPAVATALAAVDQRQIALLEADDALLAVRAEDGEIYVGMRSMCASLGLQPNGQLRRIRADEVMAEGLREVRVRTATRGLQTLQGLRLDVVPYWLSGIEPRRTKPELRERLVTYKRWVVRRVWEAFAAETGIERSPAPAAPAVAPTGQEMTLEQIAQLGIAITTLARQQMAHERALAEVRGQLVAQEDHLAAHDERIDRAATVIRDVIREVRAVQARLSAGVTITDEQAAAVQTLVRDIATAIARRDAEAGASGTRTNAYQALFGAMYRQYGVTSYKLIRADQYADVIAWLREYQRAHLARGED
jgi:hypothetical protein